MEIKEVRFETMEVTRKRCITFAKDGNTIIKPYKTLYSVENITHIPGHKKLYVEVVKDEMYHSEDSFYLYEDLQTICIKLNQIPGHWMIKKFIEMLESWEYFGIDGFYKRLREKERNEIYINKVDIETCNLLGNLQLAGHYSKYRERKIAEQKAENQKEIEERKRIELEEAEKHAGEIEKVINEAEDAFRNHQILYNRPFENTTIILYLIKKYGIKVPLKTQGWINKALAKIWFRNGEIAYSYYKGSRESTVFYKYLKELEEKILQGIKKEGNEHG